MLLEIILFIILLFIIKLFLNNLKPTGTPPGTNGLPIVGKLPGRNETMQHFLESFRKKHGDIFWVKLGERETVFVCNYEDIVAAFSNSALQGRPYMYTHVLLYKCADKDSERREEPMDEVVGIISGNGESWRNLRRFVIRRLRDGGMGKSSMEAIISSEAEFLAEDFDKHVGKPTEIPWSVNASILNIVWRLVADKRYNIVDKEIQLMCNNINEALAISQTKLFLFDLIPTLLKYTPQFILDFAGKCNCERKLDVVFDLIRDIIEEHKNTIDDDNPRDLIDSYLIEMKRVQNNSSNKSESCETFSERQLVQAIFDLFLAGSETTSSTIKWFILFMTKHPDIQKKVQAEIDNVVPRDRTTSLEDRDRLPYLESCISETLRMKPILPFALFHQATENTMIREYFIPKGTHITANIESCHRDPKNWEKPTEFYPEHFLTDEGKHNTNKQGFIPFSAGRRICPGENLAKMDLTIVLATLLQKFTFTVPEGSVISDEARPDQPFFTLPRPFKVIITRRGQS